jgi:hypothetical protein
VFLHLDGCGARINGDHVPLDGKLPTQFWNTGDYIMDRYVVPTPLITTVACTYQVFMGFFSGDNRLRLRPGPATEAGDTQRALVGTVVIK